MFKRLGAAVALALAALITPALAGHATPSFACVPGGGGPSACPGPLPPWGRFAYNGELLTVNVYCTGSWQGSHSP